MGSEMCIRDSYRVDIYYGGVLLKNCPYSVDVKEPIPIELPDETSDATRVCVRWTGNSEGVCDYIR